MPDRGGERGVAAGNYNGEVRKITCNDTTHRVKEIFLRTKLMTGPDWS